MSVLAFAPASIGNVGVGFDVLGQSAAGVGDRVRATRTTNRGVRVAEITGVVRDLPREPALNTASVAVTTMADALGLDHGFDLSIDKGIPLASGLGGVRGGRRGRRERPPGHPGRFAPAAHVRGSG